MSLTFTDCAARLTPLRRWFASRGKQMLRKLERRSGLGQAATNAASWLLFCSSCWPSRAASQPASQKCHLLLAQEEGEQQQQQEVSNSNNQEQQQQQQQQQQQPAPSRAVRRADCSCWRWLLLLLPEAPALCWLPVARQESKSSDD